VRGIFPFLISLDFFSSSYLIAAQRCQIVGDWQRRRVGAEVVGLVWFLCEIEIARDDARERR
jgi:hypothetical protein